MNTNILKSPIKNVPSCWEDDKRMTALYSPFRLRESNPVDYDSKMKFWHKTILEWCFDKNICFFSIKRIQDEFKRKERVPLGLNTVVENLEREGLIKLKEDFQKIDPNETWTGWAVKTLVKTPVNWSFTKLKFALIDIDVKSIEYISIEFLKAKNDEVLSKIAGNQKLHEGHTIRKMLTTDDGVEMSPENFEMLLKWMQLNKVIHLKQVENDVLIKFCNSNKEPISDVEINLFVLEKNKLSFENAILALEQEKDELVLTAKSYLKKGMRDVAKSYLRRKKEVEKTIAKRVSALENIEILLSKIYDSSTDSKVFETYKVALNALKQSFKENGLSEDEVINTVTEMQEINEMHEEIQNALVQPVSSIDEMELEKELKRILEEKQNVDLVLPDVPSESPEKISSTAKVVIDPAL